MVMGSDHTWKYFKGRANNFWNEIKREQLRMSSKILAKTLRLELLFTEIKKAEKVGLGRKCLWFCHMIDVT